MRPPRRSPTLAPRSRSAIARRLATERRRESHVQDDRLGRRWLGACREGASARQGVGKVRRCDGHDRARRRAGRGDRRGRGASPSRRARGRSPLPSAARDRRPGRSRCAHRENTAVMLRHFPDCPGGAATMTVAPRRFTVAAMTAKRDDRDSSAPRRQLPDVDDNLRRRSALRADLARAREMRARIERALQAARQRAMRDRG